jgi:glycosyltransferase involved in cell wall biosynthesis
MKIINLIHTQFMGGVDQIFRNYNEIILQNGHHLELVISNNGNDKYEDDNIKKIHKLKNISPIFDVIHLLIIIYRLRPNIMICHTSRTMRWMRVIKKLIPSSCKIIGVNHGMGYKKSLNCEYIFNVNKQIRKLVLDDGANPNKTFFLPNIIKIDQKFQSKKFRTTPIIGLFGRIEKIKGFDILIESISILTKKNIKVKAILG